MKTCSSCDRELELPQFPRSRNTEDGYADICKTCRDRGRTSGERAIRAAEQNRHFQKKRDQIYKLLGNKCSNCGTRTPPLHIDHVDWRKKKSEVLARQLSLSNPEMREELAKCQLLCEPCHNKKTVQDRAEQRAEKDVLQKRNEESEWLAHERKKRGRRAY